MNPPRTRHQIRAERAAESFVRRIVKTEKRLAKISERLKSFGLSDDQISSVMEFVH